MKILVCNGAHIGDVILSTSVLLPLKKAFEEVGIGMLVGSWAKNVVLDHTLVDHVHIYDQATINRAPINKKEKKKQEAKTWKTALKEMQEIGYDVALDLYTLYKKNAGHILYQAQIPERVAYWGCAAPFFFNNLLFWNWHSFHMVENYRLFLKYWGLKTNLAQKASPYLEYTFLPQKPQQLPSQYLVIHVGVGEPQREWNFQSWKELISYLNTLEIPLVFIGKGKRENRQIETVMGMAKNSINLCSRVSWKELCVVIKNGLLLIGLESMAGHLAAALDTPSVVIYGGSVLVHRWRPFSSKSHVVTPSKRYFHPTKKKTPLSAIHTIPAREVFEKIKQLSIAQYVRANPH